MRYLSRILVVAVIVGVVLAALAAQQTKPETPTADKAAQAVQADPAVNPDAAVLQDFQRRLDGYLELQRKLAKESPPLEKTSNSAEIAAAAAVLAAKIQAVRKDARAGDIFTPQIRALFRRLMYPELKGEDGPETRQAIKGHDAPPAIPLKVNAKYPSDAPLPTVPPNLLQRLPQLPEDVEYRIVGRDLILRDVDANIIVDYIPNAIQ